MSVRETEAEVGIGASKKKSAEKPKREKSAQIVYLEKALSNHLGTRMTIEEKRGGKGRMIIEFYGHEDFERLASLMHLPLPR
jgi:ParB family chromosome partitioning protein